MPPAHHTAPTVRVFTKGKDETRVSIRAEGVPIGRLMEELGRRVDRSAIMPRELGARAVWVELDDVPLEAALFAITGSVGLSHRASKTDWRFFAARDPDGLTIAGNGPEVLTRVIKNALNRPSFAPLIAETGLSCRGQLLFDEALDVLVIQDVEPTLLMIESIVRTFDDPVVHDEPWPPIRAPELSSLTAPCPTPDALSPGEQHAGTLLVHAARAAKTPMVVGCGGGQAFYGSALAKTTLDEFVSHLGLTLRPALKDRARERDFHERARRGLRQADWLYDFRANPSGIPIALDATLSALLVVHPEKIEEMQTQTASQAVRSAELSRILGVARAAEVPGAPMLIARASDSNLERVRRLLHFWWTLSPGSRREAAHDAATQSLEWKCAVLSQSGIDAHDAEQYERALDFYGRGYEQCENKGHFLHEIAWTQAAMDQPEAAADSIIRAFLEHEGGRKTAGNLALLFDHLSPETKKRIQTMGRSFDAPIYADIPTEYLWFEEIACLGAQPVEGGRQGSSEHGGSRFDIWQVRCEGESTSRTIYFNVDGDPRLRAMRDELEQLEREESKSEASASEN